MIDVQMAVLRGEPDELAEAAEDLEALLESAAADRVELSPLLRSWLVDALAHLDESLVEAEAAA